MSKSKNKIQMDLLLSAAQTKHNCKEKYAENCVAIDTAYDMEHLIHKIQNTDCVIKQAV